jgi:hypothetical protein
MSITIKGVTSGGVDLKAPDTGSNTTVTLPSATGTLLPTDGDGSGLTNLTSANLVGALPALSGANLTGLTSANLTGALPAIDGSNLTGVSGGKVLQVASTGYISGSAVTVSSTASIVLMTITLTTQANSKLMMWFDSHQTSQSSVNVNPDVYFGIDGTKVSSGTNHYFYQVSARTVISKVFLSNSVSAGSHTFTIIGESFNGTTTYNYQDNNGGVFMVQEIAQ